MHRSFILFTKRELNTPALLGTSSGITTFSGITISKIAFIGTEGSDAGSASTGGADTRGVCAGGACTRGFYTRGTFAGGACIVGTSVGNACAGGACAEGACVGLKNLMS